MGDFMSIKEIMESAKDVLTPSDIAEVLGVKPYSINLQAKQDITKLGFPCSLIGTRVRIPKNGFIRWLNGEMSNELGSNN